jgi:membrane-associated phospholipid phosphatase
VGALLVALCYFFVDRPVAYFMHDQGVARYPLLKQLTYPPPILEWWAPIVLTALAVRRSWGPLRRWEWTVVAACISLVISEAFRETLSYFFGRYWPETWVENNPSLIRDGAYGFHPFHSGAIYSSFPSGHTTRIVAGTAVFWIAYPRWRWACALVSAAVVVGLIGMDYHFVGDVVAGAFVGALVGTYTAYFFGLLTGRGRLPDTHRTAGPGQVELL